jgi:hypothetical protein
VQYENLADLSAETEVASQHNNTDTSEEKQGH